MLDKFAQAMLPLLLSCCAANASVLTTDAAALSAPTANSPPPEIDPAHPAGAWASPATAGAPGGQGIHQSRDMPDVQARDAVAQQARDNFAVGGASKASSARFQPLPVDVPSLPSPPPIPVSEPFTAAILASGLALMALLKRKERRKQA